MCVSIFRSAYLYFTPVVYCFMWTA